MAKEMTIDEMVKKLSEDIKKVENLEDPNAKLDIASMNKQIDQANDLLDILEAKFNKFNANIDELYNQLPDSLKEESEKKN